MKFSMLLLLFFMPILLLAQSPNCNTENHRAFDFWVGDWKVTGPEGGLAGFNSIRKIHGGCVIEENWTGAGVSRGSSFNHYDTTLDKWKQKWVDNGGANIEFIGEIKNDALVTFAQTQDPKTSATIYNKMTIAKIDAQNVSQVWEQSSDNITWKRVFNGHYTRIQQSVNAALATAVYDSFSVAYKTLNPELVGNLYHENALYIFGKEPMRQGHSAILESFKSHFQYRQEQQQIMQIEFKIVDRQEGHDVIADIGFYKLLVNNADGTSKTSYGKFATVLTKDSAGNWKFSSDMYHDADEAEYEKAKRVE